MPKRNRHREAVKAAGRRPPALSPADAAARAFADGHNQRVNARLGLIDDTPVVSLSTVAWPPLPDYPLDYDRDRYKAFEGARGWALAIDAAEEHYFSAGERSLCGAATTLGLVPESFSPDDGLARSTDCADCRHLLAHQTLR